MGLMVHLSTFLKIVQRDLEKTVEGNRRLRVSLVLQDECR
jgi:hypothetical protein